MDSGRIRVLIADDQVLMRDGLKTIIELEDDLEVVGTAGDGREAWELVQQLAPDVVLMDVRMPVMDGVECTGLIKKICPQTKVVMLTTFDDEEYIINALAVGADGFLLKDIRADQLLEAVRDVSRGEFILPASVAGKLAARVSDLFPLEGIRRRKAEQRLESVALSDREKDVAALMVAGLNNRQIARRLGLTEGTVKNYVSVIYEKVGTSDRNAAIAFLAEHFPHLRASDPPDG